MYDSSNSNHTSSIRLHHFRRSPRERKLRTIAALLFLLIIVNMCVLHTWLRSLHLEWLGSTGESGIDEYMKNFISKVQVNTEGNSEGRNSYQGYMSVNRNARSNFLMQISPKEASAAEIHEAGEVDIERKSFRKNREQDNGDDAYGGQSDKNVNPPLKQKPKLFLHVGPRKTATTTIQASFFLHKSFVRNEMVKDGIQTAVFPWNDGLNLVQNCLNKLPTACDLTEWHRFRNLIHDGSIGSEQQQEEQGRQNRRHVAISNEALSLVKPNEDTKIFLQALTEEWDVQVIVAYRPIEDWYLSMYQEDRSQTMYRKASKTLRGWVTDADTNRLDPDPGRISYPAWFEKKWKREYMGDPLDTIETYSYIFGADKITTLMTTRPDGVDISRQFLCEGLKAENSCAKAKGRRVPIRHNVKKNFLFDEDLLVLEAHKKGLLTRKSSKTCRPKLTRTEYTLKVSEYIEEEIDANDNTANSGRNDMSSNSVIDTNSANVTRDLLMPKVCIPSPQLKELIARAWSAERLSPYPRSQKEFATAIANLRSMSRHCSVDADAALSQKTWVDFFAIDDRLCKEE